MNHKKTQLPVKKPPLVRRIIVQLIANLINGIKSLSTAKGIVAAIPIIVSAAAFIKSSYVTTTLIMILNEPIHMQVTLHGEGETKGIGKSIISDFEVFLVSEGRDTIYISDINMNIVAFNQKGYFDEYCKYIIPIENSQDLGEKIYDSFIASTKILSQDYKYDLRSGFVITSNSILPLSVSLSFKSNIVLDEMISQSLGARKLEDYNQRVMELLLELRGPSIAFCVSGTAFTSGSSRKRFLWYSDKESRKIITSFIDRDIEPPPVAPGGQQVKKIEIKELSIRSEDFSSGLQLFTARKFSIF